MDFKRKFAVVTMTKSLLQQGVSLMKMQRNLSRFLRGIIASLMVMGGVHATTALAFTAGDVYAVAGNAANGGLTVNTGDGGPAISATFYIPSGVAVDSAGNLYIADSGSNIIRKVTASTGIITTVVGAGNAGTGNAGYSGDNGPATSAQLSTPNSVAIDSAGNLYIADSRNYRIRKVDANGIITTVAGNGIQGYSGDNGPATSAQLGLLNNVAIDSAGNLYIADSTRIRKVTASTGIITTMGQYSQYNGGYGVSGLAVDNAGNVYFSTGYAHTVYKITASTGLSTRIAGNGSQGVGYCSGCYSGDGGPATLAQFNYTGALAVDSAGNLYISDVNNERVRKVDTQGITTTIAGNGTPYYSGEGGPAIGAGIRPNAIAADGSGNLFFVTDSRVVEMPAQNSWVTQTIGTINFSPATLTISGTSSASATATSGLPIIFSSVTPNICTINGNTITGRNPGTCTIAANQAGNTRYIAAPQVTQDISNAQTQTIGTITFSPTTLTVNGSTTASATASSGLAVSFSSLTPSVCSVSGSTVTAYTTGTCTIAANQAGNSSYSAAPQMSKNITISTPTPACISPQVLQNGVCVTPTPTCYSPQVLQNGMCVTPAPTCYSPQVLQNGVCVTPTPTCYSPQVLQNGVCVTPAPTCYSPQVLQNGVCVTPAPTAYNQTIGSITFLPTTLSVGGTATVSATATSGLEVTFTSFTPTICTVTASKSFLFSANTYTVTGVAGGTCTIAANQAGNSGYSAAPQVTQSIQVAQPQPTAQGQAIGAISFSPATISVGGTATVFASATSGLEVSFTSLTPDICTVTTSKATLFSIDIYTVKGIAGGTCTIAANQAGGGSLLGGTYSAAAQVKQDIIVGAGQTDCLLNWVEKAYAQYFSPAGATDVTAIAPYTYRYYSGTRNYLAVSSRDNSVYVLGPISGNTLVQVGPVSSFLGVSGCQ